VFNLPAARPDLPTGVGPATGAPAPHGAVGANWAVIGFTAKAPTANLADLVRELNVPSALATPSAGAVAARKGPAATRGRMCRAAGRESGPGGCNPLSYYRVT
jgi:hypothetical protein